jgi:hypothetical protein
MRVKPATQSDANREFSGHRHIEWRWFMLALIALAMLDYLSAVSG